MFVIPTQANAQLVANQNTINVVAEAGVQTRTLVTNANRTIDNINTLFDRVTQANEKAQNAKTLADDTFTEARNMRTTLTDFNAQVTGN